MHRRDERLFERAAVVLELSPSSRGKRSSKSSQRWPARRWTRIIHLISSRSTSHWPREIDVRSVRDANACGLFNRRSTRVPRTERDSRRSERNEAGEESRGSNELAKLAQQTVTRDDVRFATEFDILLEGSPRRRALPPLGGRGASAAAAGPRGRARSSLGVSIKRLSDSDTGIERECASARVHACTRAPISRVHVHARAALGRGVATGGSADVYLRGPSRAPIGRAGHQPLVHTRVHPRGRCTADRRWDATPRVGCTRCAFSDARAGPASIRFVYCANLVQQF